MFVERSTQYTSFSSRKQPANSGSEHKQLAENASVALKQPILMHAHTKCPLVLWRKVMLLYVLALHNRVKTNDFKTVNILLKTVFWDNNDLGMRGETKSDDDL